MRSRGLFLGNIREICCFTHRSFGIVSKRRNGDKNTISNYHIHTKGVSFYDDRQNRIACQEEGVAEIIIKNQSKIQGSARGNYLHSTKKRQYILLLQMKRQVLSSALNKAKRRKNN